MTKNEFSTQIRVRYKDTDRMGVVYYGNYLTFFEIGRAEFMRALGFPYSALEKKGFSLVVTKASASYHANVGYDSLITVKTSISEVRKVRVRFEYEIFSEENILLVRGYTVHACIDSNMKPVRIPSNVLKAMKKTNTNSHSNQL